MREAVLSIKPMSLGTRQARTSRRARAAVSACVLATAITLTQLGVGPAGAARVSTIPPEFKPNFVLIQTDDQTLDGLYASYKAFAGAPATRAMPSTLDLIAKRGMTFSRYYVSYPLCCPSRVSLLTGRYAHNHNVRGNVAPNGGYPGFASHLADTHNIATWLQQDGYKTIHIGKFLNAYGEEPWDSGKEVPPGWSSWHTVENSDTTHFYYGYTLNNNGQIDGPYGDPGNWEAREYGVRDDFGCPFAATNGLPCYYETDKLTEFATNELAGTPAEQPFYLQLDYTAPHGDFRRPAGPEPAPREYDWFKGARLPHDRREGFDEGNVADKPRFIREAPHLTLDDKHAYRVYWQKQLEALRGVDDGVRQIVETLGAEGRLRNTYIILTSDNGFFFGEHRLLGGKFLAYEPATHLPFLIRGPGIRPGVKSGELSMNIDIAPTILELAGAEADKSIDGRSMVPFIRDPELRSRRPLLFESFVETNDVEQQGAIGVPGDQTRAIGAGRPESALSSELRRPSATASLLAPPKDYEGIRLGPYKYIAWPDGEKELYDINRDPYELNNIAKIPNFYPVRNALHKELRRMEDCVGRTCREAATEVPLTRKEIRVARKEEKEKKRLEEKERREKEREEREEHHQHH
jgi:N-acetylglucosamine-6-sulfatase